jgi:hypothetical protein
MNILCGFFSLMTTMSGFSLLERGAIAEATTRFDHAAIAIGIAFLFDSLDGRIARMTRSTTEIGIQLDSLADVRFLRDGARDSSLTPGVMEPVFKGWENASQLAWFLTFMYVICGGFRTRAFQRAGRAPASARRGYCESRQEEFRRTPDSGRGLPDRSDRSFLANADQIYASARSHSRRRR